jgi:polyketide biosynthesis acyl carrier protein
VNKEEIFELLVKHTQEIIPELGGRTLMQQDSLKDLGANSLDRADIIMMTMDELSMRFPLVELAGAKNLGDLAETFYQRLHNV